MLEPFLNLGRQPQALTGPTEIDVHDNGSRMALGHGRLKLGHTVQRQCRQAEEFQLLGQPLCPLMVLKHHINRFAQRRQRRLLQTVAMPQACTRQTLHQAIELGNGAAVQPAPIGLDRTERFVDILSQSNVLGLLETLGKAQQTQGRILQFSHVTGRPFGLLQPLPGLKNLTCLMNDPLGKMVLQAITAGIFGLVHIKATLGSQSETVDGAMLAPSIRHLSAASHLFDNKYMALCHYV